MTLKTYRICLFYCTELFLKDKILTIAKIHMSGDKLMYKYFWTFDMQRTVHHDIFL